MKPQINRVLTVVTSPIPALLCLLASVLPQWIPWILFAALVSVGVVFWWKFHKETLGIICLSIGLIAFVVGLYGSNDSSPSVEVAELGDDPLRSFFHLNQDAQIAWDTQNVQLGEQMASIALQKAIENGTSNYSFSYFDNIWKKLEAAKREGSASACYSMAYMCANGLGRPILTEDAAELAFKAVTLNPSDIYSYLLLEGLHVDSVKHPDIYTIVTNWRRNIDREDSILSRKFGEMAGFYGILHENEDFSSKVLMRMKSYKAVLYADKTSPFWRVIDENVDVLRASALSGRVSYHTLYLAAHYYSKKMCDSAVYFYDCYLNAYDYWRAVTSPEAGLYSVVPDTVISAYSRNIMPLLIGLSCNDLNYLAICVGGDKNRPVGGIDSLNFYFMNTLSLAMKLKDNRLNFKPFDHVSNIDSIVEQYKRDICSLIKTKRTVIGKEKSPKYNYNFLAEIYNEPAVGDSIPGQKLVGCGVIVPDNYDTTLIWTDVSGNIMDKVKAATTRVGMARNIKDIIH